MQSVPKKCYQNGFCYLLNPSKVSFVKNLEFLLLMDTEILQFDKWSKDLNLLP